MRNKKICMESTFVVTQLTLGRLARPNHNALFDFNFVFCYIAAMYHGPWAYHSPLPAYVLCIMMYSVLFYPS